MDNLEASYLGPPLVFSSYYKFDRAALLPKLEMLAKDSRFFEPNEEVGDAGSSAAFLENEQPHHWPELQEFVQQSLEKANEIFHLWEMQIGIPKVTQSWCNLHRRGSFTNYHTHQFADLVVSAYIDAPPRSGNLLLVDPLENHWFGLPCNRNRYIHTGYSVPVETNKVLFFAPFIRHATEKNFSDKDRWVLSMNISCKD